jgi:hypothetical protein
MYKFEFSLANTKLYSQVFACLVSNKHNELMDIKEIRRKKLRLWFSIRPIPKKEKSYISQLINNKAPFGETAARRLEKDYKMGDMYLDIDTDESIEMAGPNKSRPDLSWIEQLNFEQYALLTKFGTKLIGMGEAELKATDKIIDAADNAIKVGRGNKEI